MRPVLLLHQVSCAARAHACRTATPCCLLRAPHCVAPLPPPPADDEGEEGDTGADSADARRRAVAALGAADGSDAMPLSPRLNGAKIKPLTEGDEGGEGSAASDAMLTAPALALGAQSPALFSALRPAPAIPPVPGGLGVPAVVVPSAAVRGNHGLLGGGLGEAVLGGGSGGPGLPHSASMEGLMLPLPLHPPALEGLPQPDSMANLMALGGGSAPGSRNTSAMLGGCVEWGKVAGWAGRLCRASWRRMLVASRPSENRSCLSATTLPPILH